MSEAIAASVSPPPASQAGTPAEALGSSKATDNHGESGTGDSFSKLVSEHTDKQTAPPAHHADGEQTILQADIPGGNPLPQALPPVALQTLTGPTIPSDNTGTAVLASVASAEAQAGKLRDALGGRLAGDTGQATQQTLTVASAVASSVDKHPAQNQQLRPDVAMQRLESDTLLSNDGARSQSQNMLTGASLQQQSSAQQLHIGINHGPTHAYGLYSLSQSSVLNHQLPGADARAGQVSIQLNTPFSQADWSSALTARVAWQAGQGIQHARILVNPPELGPIQVNVSVHHDQASVQFVAHHGAVRHAIEHAMPQLRDMLDQSGMTLADANVSQHAPGEQQFSGSSEGAAPQFVPGAEGPESGDVVVELRQARANALLDAYA